MGSDVASTDKVVLPLWLRTARVPERRALHLVIAWFRDEPERVGHAAPLDGVCWLGRGLPAADEAPPLVFRESRPGDARVAAAIDCSAVSRRQLWFEPGGDGGTVRVRSTGRRSLFHNGVQVEACTVRHGDSLMLDHTAVFLVESRPLALSPSIHYPAPGFRFGRADPCGIVGESEAIWRLRDDAAAAAAASAPVLVTGESGAGKELAARLVHALSARHKGPWVARNASTLPSGLIDAELFGTARDFPNAGSPQRDGLIGAAHGGTLLLDEIGELPEGQQAHLLRVLDAGGQYQRLGDPAPRTSDFRLVAATNRDPGSLKHDFLARFTVRLHVPGLTERQSDIPLLAQEIVRRMGSEARGVKERFLSADEARIEPVLVDLLLRRRYTHHARELERVLRVSASTSAGEYLSATPEVLAELRAQRARDTSDTPDAPDEREGQASRSSADVPVDQVVTALRETDGNITRAASLLGITRYALRRLVQKHGL